MEHEEETLGTGDPPGLQDLIFARNIAEEELSLARDALRDCEAELGDFYENATFGLHWLAPDGTILRVNQAELDLLGYTREELLGRSVSFFHADPEGGAEMLRRVLAAEPVQGVEARFRCQDGSIRHVLVDCHVLRRDGRIIHTRCFTRDITDRKEIEEARERLAALVESSEDAIISKDLESRILSWNAGAERLFGYTAGEAIGRPITLLIPDESQDEEERILDNLRRGQRITHYDTVRVAKGGRKIEVSLTVSPILDRQGRVVAASSIARDITQAKQAQQALRDSEKSFRLLAEMIPSMVWTANPDGTITYANERWFDYYGLHPDQYAGRWPELVLHPDDRESCREWRRSLEQGTEFDMEVRNRRHDGVYRWFVIRGAPMRDSSGRVVQWFGTTTDVEDRKRSEQTSRFLSDASSALVELADHASTLDRLAALAVPAFADHCRVETVDADGTVRVQSVRHSDPAAAHLLRELLFRHPPRLSGPEISMKVLRSGRSEWIPRISDEFLERTTSGPEHFEKLRALGLVSQISVPLRSRERTLGVLSFATAESGRVYDAADLALAEDLARRTVVALENVDLLGALKESDRRKDEFLAMLAHELRNPLSPIRNATQILSDRGPLVPELQWAADVIDRQVHQMTRLIDDLLDVSRITRGKIELRKELVDLASVVNIAVESSLPLIEKMGHHLTISVPTQPVRIEVDPTRMAQVLFNLLSNAAKYTDEGGHIRLTAALHEDQVMIRVEDDGIGIPHEMLPRIFDLFTQLDRSLDRAGGGLGIGLTLVQRLVELHGGTVEARSDGPGRGSEFVVRLPIVSQVASREPGVPGNGGSASSASRVLVVDDNRDAAESLARLLRMNGNVVQTAFDGLEAVTAAEEFRPDIVFLDIGLPKMNGYEAARRIRESQLGRNLLLVALTGWGQEEDRRRSREAGFNHHLTKPVAFSVLQELIAGAVRERQEKGGVG